MALAVGAALAMAGAARADFDLTYQSTFTESFTPDTVLSFDDLTPGDVLMPGDPVAPGVTFGGIGADTGQRALVVDAGGGDLELQTVDLGTLGSPQQSHIVLALDQDANAAGGVVAAPGSGTSNPNVTIYDATTAALNFLSVGGPVTSFFGLVGTEASRPLRFLEYRFAGAQPAESLVLDDVAIRYAPEPEAGAAALAALAAIARRHRRQPPEEPRCRPACS